MAMRSRSAQPGLIMKFAEYQQASGVHFSTLKHMAVSPLHYLHAKLNPPQETSAMLLGRATHTAVFEPERFQLEYAVWPGDRRGNAFKEFAEECEAQSRAVLRGTEYDAALAIRDAVRGIPDIAQLLTKGRSEVSIFWRNPQTGIPCKGRLDWIAGTNSILDLKTTTNIDPGWFSSQAWRMGYFHQAAMYQEAFAVASGKGKILPFGILAVERDAPHACRLFWLDQETIEVAWREYVGWLEQVKICTDTDDWPGPLPVETTLTAPSWAFTQSEDDAVDFSGVEEEDVQKAG